METSRTQPDCFARISFDVEHLRWAVFDQDRSLEIRQCLESTV
jgi:hypothetical protein